MMSTAEEKTGECMAFCHKCGAFLMEAPVAKSYMECPGCGRNLVVNVKCNKVTVTDDLRPADEIARKRNSRLALYAAKLGNRA